MPITLRQALLRAAEVERGGAFYQTLADKTADERGQRLFEKLSRDELTHATALEQHPAAAGQTHASLELPDQTLRDLEGGEEELERVAALPIEQALNAALYVERRAELFYDTLARLTRGEASAFFAGLAGMERNHAERLRWWQTQLI